MDVDIFQQSYLLLKNLLIFVNIILSLVIKKKASYKKYTEKDIRKNAYQNKNQNRLLDK